MQEAMRKAEAAGNKDCPVKIKLVAPPAYVLNTQTLDKVTKIFAYNLIPSTEFRSLLPKCYAELVLLSTACLLWLWTLAFRSTNF